MSSTKKLVLSALFIALGIVLPFFTGQLPQIGNMLLPMHIPVLVCGFVCGAPHGLAVGLIVPLLRSVLFGRPILLPTALGMAVELAVYGLVTGLMYARFKHKKLGIYISLLTAMVCGRIAWGLSSLLIYQALGTPFTWELFATEAFVNAVPGIAVQLVLIPVLIFALNRAGLPETK